MTLLPAARFEYDHKPDPPSSYHVNLAKKTNTCTFGGEKGQRSCFIAYHNIYMALEKYVHYESRWLKCNKAEAELCSMADGSLPPTYVNLCAPECQ